MLSQVAKLLYNINYSRKTVEDIKASEDVQSFLQKEVSRKAIRYTGQDHRLWSHIPSDESLFHNFGKVI